MLEAIDKYSPYVFMFTMLMVVIEGLMLSLRGAYDWRESGVSLFDKAARVIFDRAVPIGFLPFYIPLFLQFFIPITKRFQIAELKADSWWELLLLFICIDFCNYVYHVTAHHSGFLWASHSIHHSSNSYNLAAGARSGIFLRLFGGITAFYLPVLLLGFPLGAFWTLIKLHSLLQIWSHLSWVPKLGWLEYIFVTPSIHRVHHAMNDDYLDRNFGAVFCIFDRIFGTFTEERLDNPCRYGLVVPQTSYNPLRVEAEGFLRFFSSVKQASGPFGKLQAAFGRPKF